MKFLKFLLIWFFGFLAHLWAFGVVYFCSFPENKTFKLILAGFYLALIIFILFREKRKKRAFGYTFFCFAIIALWFFSIQPNPNAVYPDHLRAAHAEIKDNVVTLHNVRSNRYRTPEDFDTYYETRTYDLNQLETVDFFVNYWGIDAIAHCFVSFGFSDGRYLPISIEIRPEVGEKYGLLDGFFKQYEILYLWADERDVVLTRTNIRKEDAYLYRVNMSPENIRKLFLSMLKRTNNLYQKPDFYNTLFHSCTNTIGDHVIHEHIADLPFYKRRFLSGDVDRRMYQMQLLDHSIPFEELRKKANINERALAAGNVPNFSEQIRTHLRVDGSSFKR